ncbi:MAG: response regulator [Geminicoccaceae bacterium]
MNILLAEDDRMLRSIMVDLLEDLDYTVHAVTNGAEAVDAAQATDYDAIFMDCEMPILDGLAATRVLLEEASRAGSEKVPIIAITGHIDPADHARFFDAGMVAVLTKPVNFRQLEDVLTRFAAGAAI